MIRWVDAAERIFGKRNRSGTRRLFSKKAVPLKAGTISQIFRSLRVAAEKKWPQGKADDRSAPRLAKIFTFAASRQARTLSQVGPATPDHVIRTKPKPWVR